MKKFEFFKKNPKTGRVRIEPFYVINGMFKIDTKADAIKLLNQRIKEGAMTGVFNEKTETYTIKES